MFVKDLLRRYKALYLLSKIKKANIGKNSYVDPSVHVLGWKNVKIGYNSCIGEDTVININIRNEGTALEIGNNCYIARRNFFTTGKKIKIGDYCLTGINNHFLGSDHSYDDPFKPYIVAQATSDDIITIGTNCWLGSNVTILKNVEIGYGSIIGAGSIVNRNIPPFSLVVGSPCKIIKRFDIDSNQWLNHDKFNGDMNLMLPTEDEYLSIIRKEYSDLQVPFIANSKRLGDI